jgi:hypothetical protein
VTPVLELADVTFRRDGKQIIDGISLTVHEGEHWALLGPNGAARARCSASAPPSPFPRREPCASSASRWVASTWRGCAIRSGT